MTFHTLVAILCIEMVSNTALSSMGVIIKSANQQRIPVFVSDIDIVAQGALAALGPSQYKIGQQTAQIIARILNGEDINQMAIEFPKSTELHINQQVAQCLDLKIPEELVVKAIRVDNILKVPVQDM